MEWIDFDLRVGRDISDSNNFTNFDLFWFFQENLFLLIRQLTEIDASTSYCIKTDVNQI